MRHRNSDCKKLVYDICQVQMSFIFKGLLLGPSIMTQISELKNCFKMLDGDISKYDLRFITLTFADSDVPPRLNQINQIP